MNKSKLCPCGIGPATHNHNVDTEPYRTRIAAIASMPQAQFDLTLQLEILSLAAIRLGLYDADDFIKGRARRKE